MAVFAGLVFLVTIVVVIAVGLAAGAPQPAAPAAPARPAPAATDGAPDVSPTSTGDATPTPTYRLITEPDKVSLASGGRGCTGHGCTGWPTGGAD